MSSIVTLDLFDRLFQDTMLLIERTITHLEREGRRDREGLSPGMVVTYAAESTRLTTQLMQSMAWLMVQKAVRSGELTAREAAMPHHRLGARRVCEGACTPGAHLLPPNLLTLLMDGRRLYDRVSRLDHFVFGHEAGGTLPDRPHPAVIEGPVLAFTAETVILLRAERARHKRLRLA